MFLGFSREGVGVHSGHRVGIRIDPAPNGAGIVFLRRNERAVCTPSALAENSALCTTVGGVATVEHLLFALCTCGVTNAVIRVRGGEIPILDGSAAPWIRALREAGARGEPRFFDVPHPLEVQGRSGHATLCPAAPSETPSLEVMVDYPDFSGAKRIPLTALAFEKIASARTFAFLRDVPAMKALGRIRGGGLHCALVFRDDHPLVPPRGPDEPLDHKLLDAVGDLFVLGALPRAHVRLVRPGHALVHALVRKMAEQLKSYGGDALPVGALP